MVQSYRTKQGENLSSILWTHYGKINSAILAAVLDENQNIADTSIVFPIGFVVHLPDLMEQVNPTLPVRTLWD